jgi:hypothetical protein
MAMACPGLVGKPTPSGSPKVLHPKACRRSQAASTSRRLERAAAACGPGWHPPSPRPPASRSCAQTGATGPCRDLAICSRDSRRAKSAKRAGRRGRLRPSAPGHRGWSSSTNPSKGCPILPERQVLDKHGSGINDCAPTPPPMSQRHAAASPDLWERPWAFVSRRVGSGLSGNCPRIRAPARAGLDRQVRASQGSERRSWSRGLA